MAAMNERPIIFSAPMVRALLAGRKTQTRRPLSPRNTYRDGYPWAGQPAWSAHDWNDAFVDPGPSPAGNQGPYLKVAYPEDGTRHRIYPLVQLGDRLWVREAHAMLPRTAYRASIGTGTIEQLEHPTDGYSAAVFREGFDRSGKPRWRPSIHMPRWASRLTLTVTDVRVQRLQEISEEDARAEGAYVANASGRIADDYATMAVAGQWFATARGWYADLWNRLHGPDAWAANPWVAAISFTVTKSNIDQHVTIEAR